MKLLKIALLGATLMAFGSCSSMGHHSGDKKACCKKDKSCELKKDKKSCSKKDGKCKDKKHCDLKKKK